VDSGKTQEGMTKKRNAKGVQEGCSKQESENYMRVGNRMNTKWTKGMVRAQAKTLWPRAQAHMALLENYS